MVAAAILAAATLALWSTSTTRPRWGASPAARLPRDVTRLLLVDWVEARAMIPRLPEFSAAMRPAESSPPLAPRTSRYLDAPMRRADPRTTSPDAVVRRHARASSRAVVPDRPPIRVQVRYASVR